MSIYFFDQWVVHVLLYGSEVWWYSDIGQIEKFRHKFIKEIMNIDSREPNVYGDSGIVPIIVLYTVLYHMM